MHPYIILSVAIAFEVFGTMLLPLSKSFTLPLPTACILVAYGMSFYCLSIVAAKMPLAVLYTTWAGCGVFSIALLSYLIYGQELNWQVILGLCLITIGVTLVNIFKVYN
ncbi:MAG: multidrug efflux SMR transporter [Pseudomonadota bacterium]|nr:multidrug efflux SMR transporter [Pseudomonadota bacterium]